MPLKNICSHNINKLIQLILMKVFHKNFFELIDLETLMGPTRIPEVEV